MYLSFPRFIAIFTLISACIAGQDVDTQAPFEYQGTRPRSSTGAAGRYPEPEPSTRWEFNLEPSPNTTGNYVFESVASLLQQWPNTRYRNGHTIVPVTLPIGTLLHHGTHQPAVPSVPAWVAIDPEHSYLFCDAISPSSGCWHLTLAATRPLKLLYFDGSSGAKIQGALDAQDLLVWGEVAKEPLESEGKRIKDLCEWGRKYELDGFLRQAVDFEIMLCDFTKGVDVVSFLNLKTILPHDRLRSTTTTNRTDGMANNTYREPDTSKPYPPFFLALESGSWHRTFPGLTRAKLDLPRLVSFYDTDQFPSLLEWRLSLGSGEGAAGQGERYDHRLRAMSKQDREGLLGRLDEVLRIEGESGVDWESLVRSVVQRYADRLEVLQYVLGDATVPQKEKDDRALEVIRNTHKYISTILAPYILNSANPPSSLSSSYKPTNLSWATPVFENCASIHTKYTAHLRLTRSEALIRDSVDSVLHEICRVLVGVWAEGVELGLEGDNSGPLITVHIKDGAKKVQMKWSRKINGLMAWLDWNVWVKCRPACGFEDMCWLPTWPGWPWTKHNEIGANPDPQDEYWRRPEPQCIRRVFPLLYLP
ncbi:hypothetical protein DFP72DRAFT_262531 [Ephemerocybe angulata]|uniref:Uncharacterized protein n=1 Tax=Ephemerocybe angulata TaxID=980116 RepID=A0A8H6I2S7_9AGAR|nr:hypothetical protein DFP72DRAFT_262531 [Tulosesus angulatus]